MKPIILLSHITIPGRDKIADICINKIKNLLPNIPLYLYSISASSEKTDKLPDYLESKIDYIKYLPNESHYNGEIKGWDTSLHDLEEKDFNVILKSCTDCLWNDNLPEHFLNPILNNSHDLVVSNTWLYMCGGSHCASTQIFCGKIDAIKKTLPSFDRNIPWFTNGMEVNFRIGIQQFGSNFRVHNIEDGTKLYQHGHSINEFKI